MSTVNSRDAGEPGFSAASVALTSKVCGPSPSWSMVSGETHAANSAASTRHSSVEEPSEAANANVGVASVVVPVGPLENVTVGAVKSKFVVATATFGSGPM